MFRSKRKQCQKRIRVWCCWHRTAYVVYVCDPLQNGAIGWRGGDELLNKFVIFVFFAHKSYSRSFIKLRLNHWCHMDYYNDLLATFLSLDRVRILAVYGRVRELLECIKNILICVPKMKSYRFGTTRGWVINDRIVIFGWTILLSFKMHKTWTIKIIIMNQMFKICKLLLSLQCSILLWYQ